MRVFTVLEAARAIHRREDAVRCAVNADPDSPRFLPSWRDPDNSKGIVIFEDDLYDWIRRVYVPGGRG
jgi:hypothetical protein